MARPTDDKKDETIRIRVNTETKEYLERRSFAKGQTISEYIRDMINADMVSKKSQKTKGASK